MADMDLKQNVSDSGDKPALPVPPPDRRLPDAIDRARKAAMEDSKPKNRIIGFFTSRRFLLLLVLSAILFAAFYIPHLAWKRAPELPLKITVVDKTVPFANYREHKGLFWILEQNKFTHPGREDDGRWYNFEEDYVGFYPLDFNAGSEARAAEDERSDDRSPRDSTNEILSAEQLSNLSPEEAAQYGVDTQAMEERVRHEGEEARREFNEMPSEWETSLLTQTNLADTDVVYLTDTYGVYNLDYTQFGGEVAHTRHGPKIFGGLVDTEVDALEWFAGQGRLLMAEFNAFASPTNEDAALRAEKLFGVHWTHWMGRFFPDFGDVTDVPEWLYKLYEAETGHKWDLSGPGYMLCRNESADFIILTAEDDLRLKGLEFVPVRLYSEGDVMQGVDASTFTYWFDVVEAQPDTEVLAEYQWHLNESGRAKLAKHGLPLVFPAVVRKRSNYTSYYMAGEMIDFNRAMGPPNTRLSLYINRNFFGVPKPGSGEYPFWHTSYPMITNILRRESYIRNAVPENVYLFK